MLFLLQVPLPEYDESVVLNLLQLLQTTGYSDGAQLCDDVLPPNAVLELVNFIIAHPRLLDQVSGQPGFVHLRDHMAYINQVRVLRS